MNNKELLKELEEIIDKAQAIRNKAIELNDVLDRLCDGLIVWKEKWYEG